MLNEYLENCMCSTCDLPYDERSPMCEEHTEYRIESGLWDDNEI